MSRTSWYSCFNSIGNWDNGEYLIEKAPNAGIVIWFKNQAAVTNIKSFKQAVLILGNEFNSINKINR